MQFIQPLSLNCLCRLCPVFVLARMVRAGEPSSLHTELILRYEVERSVAGNSYTAPGTSGDGWVKYWNRIPWQASTASRIYYQYLLQLSTTSIYYHYLLPVSITSIYYQYILPVLQHSDSKAQQHTSDKITTEHLQSSSMLVAWEESNYKLFSKLLFLSPMKSNSVWNAKVVHIVREEHTV